MTPLRLLWITFGVTGVLILALGARLGLLLLRERASRRLGATAIAVALVLGGAMVGAAWHRLEASYAESRTISSARVAVDALHNRANFERWALLLNDLSLLAAQQKLCRELGCPPAPESEALWSRALCAPLAQRCPFGSGCMPAFADAWSALRAAAWVESADGFTRTSGAARLRVSHERRGDADVFCVAEFHS